MGFCVGALGYFRSLHLNPLPALASPSGPGAATEIADFLIAESLVPAAMAAQLAAQLAPAPAAAALVAVEVRRGAHVSTRGNQLCLRSCTAHGICTHYSLCCRMRRSRRMLCAPSLPLRMLCQAAS